jgi:hypothetical protein
VTPATSADFDLLKERTIVPAVSNYACILVIAAMIAGANSAYAQETKVKLPKVIVLAQTAPVEPPYMRDPGKAYARNPYFGRYRVEEDKFGEVPCTTGVPRALRLCLAVILSPLAVGQGLERRLAAFCCSNDRSFNCPSRLSTRPGWKVY